MKHEANTECPPVPPLSITGSSPPEQSTDLARFLDVRQLAAVSKEHRTRQAEHGHVLFSVLVFCLWLNHIRNRLT